MKKMKSLLHTVHKNGSLKGLFSFEEESEMKEIFNLKNKSVF